METNNYILQKKYKISSLDADNNYRTRISSLINYFIQIAWEHAEKLGWGLENFSKLGLGWVMSRFIINIDHLPQWPGELTLNTWPKGVNRFFYQRDAEIYEKNNMPVGSITSAWLIIDKKTKRPKLHNSDSDILSFHKNKHAIDEEIKTLKTQKENPTCSVPFKIRYSDIDMNQHLTAVRYIDFMFDTYTLDFIEKNTPKKLTVNYLKELKYGDNVIMNRFEEGNTHFFELLNSVDNVICFKAEVIF